MAHTVASSPMAGCPGGPPKTPEQQQQEQRQQLKQYLARQGASRQMPTPPTSRPSPQGQPGSPQQAARPPRIQTASGAGAGQGQSVRCHPAAGRQWQARLSSVAEHSGNGEASESNEAGESGALAVSPPSACAVMPGRDEVKTNPSGCVIELSTVACSCAGACSCRQAQAAKHCCPATRQDSGSWSRCQSEDTASGSFDSTRAAAQAACDKAEWARPPGLAAQIRQDRCKGSSRPNLPPGQSFKAAGTVLLPTSAVHRKAAFFEALASGTPPQPCLVSRLLLVACQLHVNAAQLPCPRPPVHCHCWSHRTASCFCRLLLTWASPCWHVHITPLQFQASEACSPLEAARAAMSLWHVVVAS